MTPLENLLLAQNDELRNEIDLHEATIADRDATIATRDATIHDLRESNRRKDAQISRLIAVHHQERMMLLSGIETRLNQLLRLHQQLERHLGMSENRITTAPAQDDKVHGFAMTLRPLRQEGAHEIRFIAGQESYVTREVHGANGLLFDFTETGNPIDLRQNFQRVANERFRARIQTYLAENPVGPKLSYYDISQNLVGPDTHKMLSEQEAQAPNIVFRCCRSRWVENASFPLEEVAAIVVELLRETNSGLHLARLYTDLHLEVQRFIRAQRFTL